MSLIRYGWMTGACGVLLALAGGCESRKAEQSAPPAAVAAALPASLFLEAAPPEPRSVLAVKAAAEVGQELTVRGRIGGSRKPFVESRAIFTVADLELPSCDAKADDHCPTPWDYCCEPKDRLAEHLLTVQVVDESGAPLKTGLDGVQGLAPNRTVIIQGRVQSKADQNLIVAASGIFVQR